MLDQLVATFFHTRGATEEEFARARMLILGALAGAVIALISTVLFMGALLNTQAATTGLALGCCVLVLVVLRWTASVGAATSAMAISITGGFGAAAWITGDLSALGWIGVVPVAVLLLTDIKRAAVWLALSIVVIVGVGWALLEAPERIAQVPAGLLLARLVIFLLTVFGLTLAFAVARQRTLRSLEEARDEANHANARKSAFLANFSHEIRTPLNGVLGTADALLAGPLVPDVREQLQIIQRSGSSLLRTINDVLELSRVESGRMELFPVSTDLPALMGEVVDLFRARAHAGGLSIELKLEPGAPRHVQVDDLRLRQVLQNLVGNAVKFTRQGQVRVRLSGAPADHGLIAVRIRVEDTGPGIDAAAQARLFTVFSQARERSDRAEGSGLGLALSKQFVDLMGGRLRLDSQPGQGTTFEIALSLPPAEQASAAVERPPAEVSSSQLKVLVVDDNQINLRVATALLSKLGHEVVMAHDGSQALAAVTEHQPDVVLMDCHMPVLDGLDATRALRARGDGRPVVAVTASVSLEDQQRCREAGMNHFLAKPLSLQSLRAALQEVAPRVPAPPPLAPAPVTGQRKVLVLDDDPHVRRMTVRLLRAEGWDVSEAGDVETARAHFTRSAPDVLLVDRVLGGAEDGVAFARRLTGEKADLQVVLTSGWPPADEEVAALRAAGMRFLAKPYNRRGLVASLGVLELRAG